MILGQYTSKLSSQRRTAIPAKFRTFLGKKFIAAQWYEGCLVFVSRTRWEALLKRLTGEDHIVTKSIRTTERFILGSAYELESDSQGRVVLPDKLVEFASLKNEVIFLGLGDRIEIWDKSIWKKQETTVANQASAHLERAYSNEK